MTVRGLGWGGIRPAVMVAVLAMIVSLMQQPLLGPALESTETVSVIVRQVDGAGDGPAQLVSRLGGAVGKQLGIVNGFSAVLPVPAVPILAANPQVTAVTPDVTLTHNPWSDAGWNNASSLNNYQPKAYAGSMYWVAQEITGAGEYWNDGFDGTGVDVALIDTGVVPVNGLTYHGKVVNGVDLSFESQSNTFRYLDTYGHGTHMAGIIAGRDNGATVIQKGDEQNFLGMAPGARVVSVKVGDFQGSVDVSQVIAAIDWIVEHKSDNGMNIKVINLSFGTNGVQSYTLDPLAFAVEQAWKKGIVVVVAAGNDGNSFALRNPALDPYVLAVGASQGNKTYGANDDNVMSFSNCGTSARKVDVMAPGGSIVSLRSPGSFADVNYPEAVVAQRFFLGSGSSQAAAVVSGAVALIFDQRPNISPDQVKKLLKNTAQPINNAPGYC